MIPPAIPAMLAAVPVTAITGTASPSCSAAGGGVEGDDRGEHRDGQPRAGDQADEQPCAPAIPVSALMAVSETPNRTPEAAPSMTPWCSAAPPMRGPMISSPPMPNRPASKQIMATSEKLRVGAVHGRQRDAQQHQPGGGGEQAEPLAAADLEAEHPLGHHGDEDHARRRARPGPRTSAPATARPRAGPSCRPRSACRSRTTSRSTARRAERSGCMTRTLGTELAPRYLKKNPRFATKAQASARRMPRSRVIGEAVEARGRRLG